MSRSGFLLAAVLMFVSGLAVPARAADADEAISLWFRADIAIAADGSVSKMDWRNYKKMPEAALTGLEQVVATWQFQPGTVEDMPAETETTLIVQMLASEQEDGSFGLSIADAFVGPSRQAWPTCRKCLRSSRRRSIA